MIRVEYDDGQAHDRGRSPSCTAKGRPMGMYVILSDGTEHPLNIGFMRVSEMKGLERLLNVIAGSGMSRQGVEEVIERLRAQHPEVCVGKVPVMFSPDQVHQMLKKVNP
jgi:hypothetical protein